jgi:PilZ domain
MGLSGAVVSVTYFRGRAAEARAMARLGHDLHLRKLLLEVSRDLDAEAALIEAGLAEDRRQHSRLAMHGRPARLTAGNALTPTLYCELLDLSFSGARIECAVRIANGTPVTLEPYPGGPMLPGEVARIRETPAFTFHIGIRFASDMEVTAGASEALGYLALDTNGADATAARPASNNLDRNASSPLNLEEIGRSSSASSAS